MIKRKIDDYIRNYYETNRNALLITGARQIGKTYSIRQFGKTFKSFIEVNFVEMPEAVDLFKGAKSSGDILLRLSAITSVPRNDKSGGLAPLNLCRNHCQPAWRSLSAATFFSRAAALYNERRCRRNRCIPF